MANGRAVFIVCSFLVALAISLQVSAIASPLKAFYDFQNVNGTTVFDSTGNWPGTLTNGASIATIRRKAFLNLDGQDDFMSMNPDLLNNMPRGTVEAYIYVRSLHPIGGATILAKGTASLTDFILTVKPDGGLTAHMGTPLYLHSQNTIPLNTWTKVALTWNGIEWKLYINDQLEAQANTTAVPPQNGANVVKVGKHDHIFGPFYFDGQIDDLHISNAVHKY